MPQSARAGRHSATLSTCSSAQCHTQHLQVSTHLRSTRVDRHSATLSTCRSAQSHAQHVQVGTVPHSARAGRQCCTQHVQAAQCNAQHVQVATVPHSARAFGKMQVGIVRISKLTLCPMKVHSMCGVNSRMLSNVTMTAVKHIFPMNCMRNVILVILL